jgi:PTH1 family peptidyl-tRNA hydrolase
MKLIVGLGNPGEKYINNRHNVGYLVAENLKSQISNLKDIMVTKTNTFMNESGEFVKKLVEQYKMDLSNLWVIHDDLDIPLGAYKIQFGKGPKDHKGLESIDRELGTNEYWHVRIGIENREVPRVSGVARVPQGEEYVLENFTTEELKKLRTVISEICKKLVIS